MLAYAALLPASRTVTGMVTEWAPASIRDPAGAMLLAAIGVLVVALARSRAHAHVPEQLLRMVLLAGLTLWAVRASVWFGLALPVAICALAWERAPRPAAADRGMSLASGLVLAALAVAWLWSSRRSGQRWCPMGYRGRPLRRGAAARLVGCSLRRDRRTPDAGADRVPGRLRALAARVLPRR